MEKILLYKIIIFGIIGMSILLSIMKVLRSSNIDYVISPIIDTIASILTFMLILLKYENINSILSYFIKNILGDLYLTNGIIKIIGIIALF
ncbi:transglutaminase domain-containing protein, partial [Clostridium botulinum]|nr:transglutaminase domain-containing protein [Clostridium botulinum]